MVLDSFVEIEIGGIKYKLCLKNKCAFAAEAELGEKNLMVALSKLPLSSRDAFVLFKWGLIGGGTELTDDAAFELYLEALQEKSNLELHNAILELIAKSGLVSEGKKVAAAKQA